MKEVVVLKTGEGIQTNVEIKANLRLAVTQRKKKKSVINMFFITLIGA